MKNSALLLIILTIFSIPIYAESKDKDVKAYTLSEDLETIKLTKLLDSITKSTDKKFLINSKTKSELVAYGIDSKTLNFNELLLVLENNQMGAVDMGGYINIVSLNYIKQSPIPVITSNSKIENEALWVTKVIEIGQLNSSILKPMIRSLVPLYGHLADYENTSKMLVVAPYNNIRKIESIIQSLQTESIRIALND